MYRTHAPLPLAHHTLITANGTDISCPDTSVAIAVLRVLDKQSYRVCQAGIHLSPDTLTLTHIQGAGPTTKLRRAGISPHALFQELSTTLHIHPFRLLISGITDFATRRAITHITCTPPSSPHEACHLNYPTILYKNGFRPNPSSPHTFVFTPEKAPNTSSPLRQEIVAALMHALA